MTFEALDFLTSLYVGAPLKSKTQSDDQRDETVRSPPQGGSQFTHDPIDDVGLCLAEGVDDEPDGDPPNGSVFEPLGSDGCPTDSIDPNELTPCSTCGTLELWQTLVGNWRCQRCDPPATARRLRELSRRLRTRD